MRFILCDFLDSLPPLKLQLTVSPSDELSRLRAEVDQLRSQLGKSEEQLRKVEFLLGCETRVNGELNDLLREHGIQYRQVLRDRHKGSGS